MKPDQMKPFLVMNPASIPVADPGTPVATGAPRDPPATPPRTQGRNNQNDGQGDLDSPTAARGTGSEDKLPAVYGARDPNQNVKAKRVDVPEDLETNHPARLLLIFENLDLKGKGNASGIPEDDSELPDADEGDGSVSK